MGDFTVLYKKPGRFIIFILLVFMGVVGLESLEIGHTIAPWLDFTLKWIVFPASLLGLGYAVFKNNSKFRIFLIPERMRTLDNKAPILLLEFGFIILSPIFIIYLSYGYLGLIGKYVAKKHFSETVIVKDVTCYSRTKTMRPNVRLDISTGDNQQAIAYLNYRVCERNPYLYRLKGQTIILYGKRWALGTLYTGLYYQPNINIKEK
jgi:hypothetical protein